MKKMMNRKARLAEWYRRAEAAAAILAEFYDFARCWPESRPVGFQVVFGNDGEILKLFRVPFDGEGNPVFPLGDRAVDEFLAALELAGGD